MSVPRPSLARLSLLRGALHHSAVTALRLALVLVVGLGALRALDGTITDVTLGSTSAAFGFKVYLPPNYAGGSALYPVLIQWAGVGHEGNGTTDLSKIAQIGPMYLLSSGVETKFRNAIVVAPQRATTGASPYDIRLFVQYLKGAYRIDPNRVLMTGWSAAGKIVWDYANYAAGLDGNGVSRLSDQCAAIAPVCGLYQDTNSGNPLVPERQMKLPEWAFHAFGDSTNVISNSIKWMNDIATGYHQFIYPANPGYTSNVMGTYPSGSPSVSASATYTASYDPANGWAWTAGAAASTGQYPLFTVYPNGNHGTAWTEAYDANSPLWDWIFAQVNTPPTITALANQSVSVSSTTAALPFTIDDPQTGAKFLILSAASSNLTLVPTANIALRGTGASRTVTVTPAAGQSGTATITVRVSDGLLSATSVFTVTAGAGGPVNTPPTITDTANQASVFSGTVIGPLSFVVSDVETALDSLAVAGASSNTALVPVGNIVFAGSGGSRSVTVTPVAGQIGSSTITLAVTDGSGATASDTFIVTWSNRAPIISAIPNQADSAVGAVLGPITFTVGDVETAPSALTLSATSDNATVAPVSGISFGGNGANRTVTVTPASGQSGAATIAVTVSDPNGGSTSDAFTINVVPSANQAPTISHIVDPAAVFSSTVIGPLSFTVSDAETTAGALVISASSSNTAVVPVSGITFGVGSGGSTGSRTVTVTSAANQSGRVLITLTVTDAGGATATDSFTATIVNHLPTISDVPDQTALASGTSIGPLPFTVGDTETALTALSLTTASSNTALVPLSGIILGGSGGSRTVTVSPVGGQTGTALITLTVADNAGGSASDTFTVAFANQAPTISAIAAQSAVAGAVIGPLPFTIGDGQSAPTALTLSATSSNAALIPLSGIVFAGNGANRNLTITPAAGQIGSSTIAVTVSDGALTATTSFTCTLTAPVAGVSIHVNFQPASAPNFTGYLVDSGAVFGARGNGLTFGWSADASDGARDRNDVHAADQRYDTLIYMQPADTLLRWEIALPNGDYQVHVVVGDPTYYGTPMKMLGESTALIDGTTTSASRFLEATAVVPVTDGRMTLSAPAGASATKLMLIDITQPGGGG